MTQMTRWRAIVGVLVLTAGVAACGDDKTPTSPTPAPAPAPAPAPSPAPAATAASFIGTVSDSTGARIAGARVTVIDGPNAGQAVTTDASGQYRFESLTISNANFSATSGGYREVRAGTYVDGNNTLNFVFTHALLAGTVRNSNGARVGGATVTVLDGPNAGVSVGANSDGDYRFEALLVANANVVAMAEGHDEARGGTFVNGTNNLDLTLTAHAPSEEAPADPGAPAVTITTRIITGGVGSVNQEWEVVATATVEVISCDWEFGDGAGAERTACVERHVYRSGTYTVKVRARRPNGERIEGELEIRVE